LARKVLRWDWLMISFGFRRRGLAPFITLIEKSGFAAIALAGRDVAAMIEEECSPERLIQAIRHARAHKEQLWTEKCARRLAMLVSAAEGQVMLASALVSTGQLAEATNLLAAIPTRERSMPLYMLSHAALLAKQGHANEALGEFDRLSGNRGTQGLAPIILSTAEEMMRHCPLHYSTAFISRLHARYQDHLLLRSLLARCLIFRGDLEEARKLALIPVDLLPRASEYERRQMRETSALSLALPGWNDELFDFARAAITEDPTHWAMYHVASEAAGSSRRADYDQIISRLPSEHAKTTGAIGILYRWKVAKGETSEAKILVEDLRGRAAAAFLHATLFLNIHHGSAEDVTKAFNECLRCGTAPLGPVNSYGMYLYFHHEHHTALRVFEQHKAVAENNVQFWQFYLRSLIAANRSDEAMSSYRSLPRGLQTAARLRPFDMFFDQSDGRVAEAAEKWTGFLSQSRHVCVNRRTGDPQAIALRYVERSGKVLLFSTVFNASPYIDWFLDHYRTLGVDHFLFVDNASDDGTPERLLREPDVSLFSNPGSYATSGFGVAWINHLLQRFGNGHWCFSVDVDEAFVFPGCERGRTLQHLLSYLDNRGYAAVSAIELDMYPERLDAPRSMDLFSEHRYFDTDYRTAPCELPPYTMIQGGIRRRMTGLALPMIKTPLVRVASDFRYIHSNHNTTHLPVADITAALLHYKFVGDVASRLNEAVRRGEHAGGALFYRRLHGATNERVWKESLLSEFSRRYEGPKSLEAAGLVTSSPTWKAFQPAR
jgi:hypothetical protein